MWTNNVREDNKHRMKDYLEQSAAVGGEGGGGRAGLAGASTDVEINKFLPSGL